MRRAAVVSTTRHREGAVHAALVIAYLLAVTVCIGLYPAPVSAQANLPMSQAPAALVVPPPFLILEQERVLAGSLYGQDLLALNDGETEALRAEGQRLDAEFEAEERALSDRRASLSPEAFRALADAFDEKVVATRASQEEKAAALAARLDRRRRNFFARVGPILLALLEETGAAAIVEQRTVLVAKQDLNITNEVIRRLDLVYRTQPETPDE